MRAFRPGNRRSMPRVADEDTSISTLDDDMRAPSWRMSDIRAMLARWGLPKQPSLINQTRAALLMYWDVQVRIPPS